MSGHTLATRDQRSNNFRPDGIDRQHQIMTTSSLRSEGEMINKQQHMQAILDQRGIVRSHRSEGTLCSESVLADAASEQSLSTSSVGPMRGGGR